jgi:hypothetical protein
MKHTPLLTPLFISSTTTLDNLLHLSIFQGRKR